MAFTEGFTYSETGVDVKVEAKAAKILYSASRESWNNRIGDLGHVIVPFNNFSGLRYINVAGLPSGTVLSGGSDGIATKSEIMERAGKFDTAAFDLIAMVCDDAVVRGGEPVILKSVLDVNTLGQDDSRLAHISELALGYIKAAREANVVILNGEIAQLNDRLGPKEKFIFNWGGDVTWFGHESRLFTGFEIQPSDYLIGLSEPGFRGNGISLLRKIMESHYGSKWEDEKFNGKKLIDIALTPSIIYSRSVVDMFGGWDLRRKPKAYLHGVAHITGGGIPEKLGRVLTPSGLGAEISNPYAPNELMLHCQKIGNVTDKEAYNTWNMGQGMIVVSPNYHEVLEVAKAHNIEAKIIGQIKKEPGIKIKSKGLQKKTLKY